MLPRYIIQIGFTLSVSFLAFVGNGNSQAAPLIAGDTFNRSVYDINRDTGIRGEEILFPFGGDGSGPSGMAYSPTDDHLYITTHGTSSSNNNGSRLFRVSTDELVLINSSPRNVVAPPMPERITYFPFQMVGLAFDSNRNLLIGADQTGNPRSQSDIYHINPDTGERSLLASVPKGNTLGGIGGLAFDSSLDLIYAVDDSFIGGTQLFTIDPDTGAFSIAGEDDELIRLADGTTFNDIDSLTFDPDRKVLWAINDGDHSRSSDIPLQQLLMIDLVTKIATPVGDPMTNSTRGYDFQGLAFITPEPSVATLLLTGIAMASVRRRRA